MNPGYLFGPKDSSISLSELNDSSDEDLLPIKNIAMSVIQNASEDQLKQPVQEWMEYCHKQGVMWLPLYQNTNSKNELAAKLVKAWPAILLKIIKIILEEKANGPKKRGLVFILLGKKARSLEQMVRAWSRSL
jgi:uracil DNA glycosylase